MDSSKIKDKEMLPQFIQKMALLLVTNVDKGIEINVKDVPPRVHRTCLLYGLTVESKL